MAHKIIEFSPAHIAPALALWNSTEHLGVGTSDVIPDLQAFLDRNARYSHVATDEDSIIGTVLAGQDGRRGYIYHLATSGSHRREGVASALLEASISALTRARVRKCHAFVFRSNPYADLFWRKAGWLEREELIVFSKELEVASQD